MYLGSVVEVGTADQVYFNPTHPYTKALLSSVPEPDPTRKNKERIVLQGDIPTPLNKPSGCGFRTRCPIARPECAQHVPVPEVKSSGAVVACPYVD
jgi:peptide/nickel transport system ATP-binding protein/oligopeptide transport system ATP-binding protein